MVVSVFWTNQSEEKRNQKEPETTSDAHLKTSEARENAGNQVERFQFLHSIDWEDDASILDQSHSEV